MNNLDEREWVKVNTALRMFEVSRATLFRWIERNRIKSTCIREKGNIRGIRLIYVPSVRALLEQGVGETAVATGN